MSTKRRLDRTDLNPQARDVQTGKWSCRWPPCSRPLEGRLRSFHPECLREYLIRADPSFAAREVEARDAGVCFDCKTDTTAISAELESVRSSRSAGVLSARVHFYVKAGFDRHRLERGDRLWDVDHAKPVVQGGGGCGLEGLVTRCQPCHKAKSAKEAGERAEARALDKGHDAARTWKRKLRRKPRRPEDRDRGLVARRAE